MSGPPPIQIDNWQDAERNAAMWMRSHGFPDAVADPGGSDGGVDVRAAGALAQVKFKGSQVGRPELQRLVGARMRDHLQLLFFTGSNYSSTALEYAESMEIALFQYDPWGRMSPKNRHAGALINRPAALATATVRPVRQTERPRFDTWTAKLARHMRKHWLAWLGGFLVVSAVVVPFDEESQQGGELYGGPWWLDLLTSLALFAAGSVCVAIYWRLRRNRKSRQTQ